jgi:thioredoxin reductase (NADPH)
MRINPMTLHDCLIIGGGPAGLSAAMTARRAGLGVLLLEKDIVGGGPAVLAAIDNYPGIAGIDGWTLTRTMEKQARDLGVEILESTEAVSVLLMDDTTKTVTTDNGRKYGARTVIIASGGAPKRLHVEGEERLIRRGVHYCAQCAGPAYKERTVMVCGNGGPALTAADHLLKLAVKRVIFVTEDQQLAGDVFLAADLVACDRFQFLPRTRVRRLTGASQVAGVVLLGLASDETWELAVDAVFVYRGIVPCSTLLAADRDPQGYLQVDPQMQTSMAGVFGAGSVVRSDAQIVIAAGEGARAGLAAAAWVARSRSPVID